MCLFVLQQTKRKLDDANKRLEFLYDKLREQTVSSVLLPSTPLLLMASLVQYYFCSMQQGYIFFRSVLQIHLLEVYMDFFRKQPVLGPTCLCRLCSVVLGSCNEFYGAVLRQRAELFAAGAETHSLG